MIFFFFHFVLLNTPVLEHGDHIYSSKQLKDKSDPIQHINSDNKKYEI